MRAQMALTSGTKLGPYEIQSPLGAGGMGEVYRARDTRLSRTVAVKILPAHLSQDAEARDRFDREAQAISSLSHPNICHLYDVGNENGISYLVMEYVEGETLANRLRKGPLPLDQVLKVGAEICEGLEKAHRSGVVHRDLKPSNIMLAKSGAKLMDFGLAKATVAVVAAGSSSDSLATMSQPLTAKGTIVGTFQYMSPEQVEGKNADTRSDIFSLGAVLYEMVTGKRAFEGKTTASTMAAILASDPPPISAVQPMSSVILERLIKSCLAKDPDERLQTAHDVKLQLKWVSDAPLSLGVPVGSIRAARFWMTATFVLLVAITLITAAYFMGSRKLQHGSAKRAVIRLSGTAPLALARLAPLGIGRTSFALSPNGTNLVYVADLGGTSQLYLRPLDQLEATPVPGTQGAYGPFFSPDGGWVGFFAENKLKKVSLQGGDPVVLCEARTPHGGSWGPDDTIVFSDQEGSKLVQVPASGGRARTVPIRRNETLLLGPHGLTFYSPQILPGGKWVLVSIPIGANWDFARIAALSLETGELDFLINGGTSPHFVATGHLVFTRGKTLMAAPFDVARRKVTGAAVTVLDGVKTEAWGAAQFAVSDEGTLIYLPGSAGWMGKLVSVDRRGVATPLPLAVQAYGVLKFSPDGQRLAVEIGGATDDVWVYESAREAFTRLTTEGANSHPTWNPDGKRVTFGSFRDGTFSIAQKFADGSGTEERLLTSKYSSLPGSWSPDGSVLAFSGSTPTDDDVWILPMKGDRTPQPFLQTHFAEWGPGFSPDGHWIAYTSDESGRSEVYVRPYPGPGGKWQISTEGGEEPRWSRTGELFYRNATKWMAVRVQTSPAFSAEKPKVMFEGNYINVMGIEYDVAPDGKHFVMIQANEPKSPPTEFNVVLNWFSELQRQVLANKE
jgi:eukaryotic-like serine/threonine-protein kinase